MDVEQRGEMQIPVDLGRAYLVQHLACPAQRICELLTDASAALPTLAGCAMARQHTNSPAPVR